MESERNQEEIKIIREILKKNEIEMSVEGCGCCGSPIVFFKYKNKVIVDYVEAFEFSTDENQID